MNPEARISKPLSQETAQVVVDVGGAVLPGARAGREVERVAQALHQDVEDLGRGLEHAVRRRERIAESQAGYGGDDDVEGVLVGRGLEERFPERGLKTQVREWEAGYQEQRGGVGVGRAHVEKVYPERTSSVAYFDGGAELREDVIQVRLLGAPGIGFEPVVSEPSVSHPSFKLYCLNSIKLDLGLEI